MSRLSAAFVRLATILVAVLCVFCASLRPGSAAVVSRFNTIAKGASITHAGNTLGLSPTPAKNPEDDIGALITTNTALQVPGYPAGTTTNWTQDSSTATLNLPPGATILYAELEWAYTSVSSTGLVPTPAAAVTQPVTLSGPGGTAIVSPDPATLADTRDPGDARRVYSTRSAIVTGLIAAGPSGQYTVGAVPAIIDPADSGTAAGWSLIVVYGNPLIGHCATSTSSSAVRSSAPAQTVRSCSSRDSKSRPQVR